VVFFKFWLFFEFLQFKQYIHSITFIQCFRTSPFAEVPLNFLSGKTPMGCRAENLTRACLTASKPTHNQNLMCRTNPDSELHNLSFGRHLGLRLRAMCSRKRTGGCLSRHSRDTSTQRVLTDFLQRTRLARCR
jgi:hypothetical protein